MDIKQKKFSWKDITIAEYYKLLKINELPVEDREPKLVAMLCDVDEDDINKMDFGEFNEIRSGMNTKWLKNFEVNEEKKIKTIKLKDKTVLNVEYSIYKFSVSQFIDLDSYKGTKDCSIEQLLSILAVPEGHNYCENYDVVELQERIKNEVDIKTGLYIINFWTASMLKSYENIARFLIARTQTKDKTMKGIEANIIDSLSGYRG